MAPTPLPQGYHPMAHEGVIDPKIRSLFQQVIRSLLYLILETRPDIAYAVITHSIYVTIYLEHVITPLYLMDLPRQA